MKTAYTFLDSIVKRKSEAFNDEVLHKMAEFCFGLFRLGV